MAKHIPKYYVFLDSNAMLGRHWVKSTLLEQIRDLHNVQLAEVRFFLPGIVYQEWSRHYINEAQKHLKSLAGSQRELERMGITAINVSLVEEELLQSKADLILKQNFIYVVDTPYDTIDLRELLDRAVRHVPPFEPGSDKGIKDAVLAHTIYEYYDKHKKRKSAHIVAITRDKTLTNYLEEILGDKGMAIYGTLEDFASSLRLSVDQLSSDLLARAKAAFYTRGDTNSLYHTADVAMLLKKHYDQSLGDPPSPSVRINQLPSDKITGEHKLPDEDIWTPMDHKYSILGTSFIRRANGRLHWITVMSYKQAYALSTQNIDGLVLNNPSSVIHTMKFNVKWSSTLKTGRTLSSLKISSVELIDESASVDPFPAIDYEKGITNLTRPSTLPNLSLFGQSLKELAGLHTAAFESPLLSSIETLKKSIPGTDLLKSIQPITDLSRNFFLNGINSGPTPPSTSVKSTTTTSKKDEPSGTGKIAQT